MMERILCAAIHWNDGEKYLYQPKNVPSGLVVCGLRHHNCFHTLSLIKKHITEREARLRTMAVQGFLTSHDRFVDRREAAEIAVTAGQAKGDPSPLFSEDLY